MTWPLLDNFNEASQVGLEVHTPDSGGAWIKSAGWVAVPTPQVDGGIEWSTSASISLNNITDVPSSADYEVEVTMTFSAISTSTDTGPAVRVSDIDRTSYVLALTSGDALELALQIWTPVGKTVLASHSIPGFSTGVEYAIKLGVETVGGNPVLHGYVDGVEILVDGFPFTDSSIDKILPAFFAGMMNRNQNGPPEVTVNTFTAAITGAPALPVLSNPTTPVYTP